MSEHNDFVDKAGSLLAKAADTAKDLASAAAAVTKQLSRTTKLNMEIVAQKDVIKKAYAELGRLYYENHHDEPEGILAQVCQEIDVAKATIAELEAEISLLKTGKDNEAQDADFESVVDATAAEACAAAQEDPEPFADEEEDSCVPEDASPDEPCE